MAKVFRVAYLSDGSNGVRVVNTHHVVVRPSTIGATEANADKVRDALDAALTAKYRAILPTDITIAALVVSEELPPGSTDVPDQASKTIALAGQQPLSGDRLPFPLCALATFYTNAAVRSGHGRMFLPNPGNASALATSGFFDPVLTWFATTAPAFLTELRANHAVDAAGIGDATASQVVYSRTRRAAGAANWYFDVTSAVLRGQPHWLRSRTTAP